MRFLSYHNPFETYRAIEPYDFPKLPSKKQGSGKLSRAHGWKIKLIFTVSAFLPLIFTDGANALLSGTQYNGTPYTRAPLFDEKYVYQNQVCADPVITMRNDDSPC